MAAQGAIYNVGQKVVARWADDTLRKFAGMSENVAAPIDSQLLQMWPKLWMFGPVLIWILLVKPICLN